MSRCLPIAACVIAVTVGACSKQPTEPVPGKPEIVYAVTERYPTDLMYRVYFIDTQADSVVDSILRPGPVGEALGVSPDGSRLYLRDGVIDTRTKADIPGALTGVPTPDGQYLIYTRVAPDTLCIADARTNEIVFLTDTMSLVNISPYSFDTLRGLVYGAIPDSALHTATHIGVFDYRNFEMVKEIVPAAIGGSDVLVQSIVISRDGTRLYYASSCFTPYFTCIDLARDTVDFIHLLNGTMSLAMTPDGQRIYITDPGGYILPDLPASGLIQVFSPPVGDFDKPINIAPTPNPCDSVVRLLVTDQIVMHPSGKKAYMSTFDNFSIVVIDIPADTVGKVLCGFGFVRSMAARR